MSKILWIDTETTGTNPVANDIIQIAGIVEINGKDKEEFDLRMAPQDTATIEPAALKVHGISEDELKEYPSADRQLAQFVKLLGRYVDRYNRQDKFVIAGYNVGFDKDFLRKAFEKAGDKYFGSWFHFPTIDVAGAVAEGIVDGSLQGLENFKLETLCRHFEIEIKAHDALSDIQATRELYRKLKEGKKT